MVDYEPKKWLAVLLQARGSVARAVAGRTLLSAALGALAYWLFVTQGVKVPPVAHTMVGVALGLLLVFRTNASYDRYWEGRRLLGAIVNRTRDLARQLRGYVPESEKAGTESCLRLLDAYFALAIQSLRSETDLEAVQSLQPDERKRLASVQRARPTVVLAWVTKRIDGFARAGHLSEARLLAMDGNVTALVDAYSGCERIARTPVPFAYAQHIKLFVTLFCLTLPFAIVDTMKLWTPVASALLAFALFGIDEIGVEIEDPFGTDDNDLPIDRIAQTISVSMRETLGS
jgi:putative membrane protein